jgi:hypothetical protein
MAHKTAGCPRIRIIPTRPSLVRATGVPDRLDLPSNLQESSHQRARGPREFASVQRILGVGYGGVGALFRVSGPMTKRKRGRILGMGYRIGIAGDADDVDLRGRPA